MESFRAGWGCGQDWIAACDACLDDLAGLPPCLNLGFIYVSEPIAHGLDLITKRLAAATGVTRWIGTGGAGVCTTGKAVFGEPAIVVLLMHLPEGSYRLFDGLDEGQHGSCRVISKQGDAPIGVVHGDPRQLKTTELIERLGRESGAFLVGGLTSASGDGAMQMAGHPTEGGLSGILIDPDVPLITGLSQGCTPIGPVREVTSVEGAWIAALDGEPALDLLNEDAGDILAREPERMVGFINVALPRPGLDFADYLVRELGGFDRSHRAIAINDTLHCGDRLLFVKRDPPAALTDLRRLVRDLRHRAGEREIKGALYHSCISRERNVLGSDSAELILLAEELGHVPLAGFFTGGEIFRDRLYSYAAVLTLFLG